MTILRASATRQTDTIANNDTALMAWALPDFVRALVRDPWLNRESKSAVVAAMVQRLVAGTDRARGVPDYAGRSQDVWSTTRNTTVPRARVPILVETARMAEALSEAAEYLTTSRTRDSLASVARATAVRAVHVHDREWRQGGRTTGWYVSPSDAPLRWAGPEQAWPLNWQSAAGLVLWNLGRATHDTGVVQRSQFLYRLVVGGMKSTVDSMGQWTYWYKAPPGYPAHPDDVAHAAFTAEFVTLGRIFDASGWEDARSMVERDFLSFYPDSLTGRDLSKLPNATHMATELGRWVEWFPNSPAVRKTVLRFAQLGTRVPNVEWYLVCSTLGAWHADSSVSGP